MNSQDRVAMTLSVIAGIGFPAVFGFVWTQTGSLWQALGLMVVYGGIVFIVGLVSGVAQRLQPLLIDGAVNGILSLFTSREHRKYRKPYLDYLYHSHRTFDVKGLVTRGEYTLDLEHVFVDLSIAPEHRPGHSPVGYQPGSSHESHSIWWFLEHDQLGHLAVIGPPGSGKTTLIKFMTLALARPTRNAPENLPDKLPVLLFLRNHAQAIADNPQIRLTDLILANLDLMAEKAPEKWFDERLDRGECLIMLDGLDEVGELDLRRAVVNWVEQQTHIHHQNRFVVTSRPYGYLDNPIAGFTQLEVRPFNRQQVEQFVTNWYLANEIMSQQRHDEGVEMDATRGSRDLLSRLYATSDVAQLAVNPLLLTMIANVHRYRDSLPGSRVDLYAEMCEVFLGKRDDSRFNIPDDLALSPSQKQDVLQPLALAMLQAREREIPFEQAADLIKDPLAEVTTEVTPAHFLTVIQQRSGILVEREHGRLGFSHKSFQEYMAAAYLFRTGMIDDLLDGLDEVWWHETIRLFSAQADASPVIDRCLRDDPPPIPRLVLALECAAEARRLDPAVRQRLDYVVEAGLVSDDRSRRRVAAEAKLAYRLKHLTRLDDDTYIDTTPITQAEYEVLMDEGYGTFDQPANISIPHHWEPSTFDPAQGKEPLTGVTGWQARQFCDWLGLATYEPTVEWRYRLPRPGEAPPHNPITTPYWMQPPDSNLFTLSRPLPIPTEWQTKKIIPVGKDYIYMQRAVDLPLGPAYTLEEVALLHYIFPNDHEELAAARALIRAIELNLYLPHALDHALDRVVTRARARATVSEGALASAVDRALARALASAIALDRALARDRALALDLALARAIELARAIDLALDQMVTRDRAIDLALDRAVTRARARDLALARAIELDRAAARESDQDLSDLIALFQDINALIIGYIFLADEQAFFGKSGDYILADLKGRPQGVANFRDYLFGVLNAHSNQQPERPRRGTSKEWDIWNTDFEVLINAYCALELIERRRTGEWDAPETILIVKERVKPSGTE